MRREIDKGIAVGVRPSIKLGTDFFPAEENRAFVRECHSRRDHVIWCIRLEMFHDAVMSVAGGDDLRLIGELRVPTTVVGMIVSAQDVSHRLIGDTANPGHDLCVVLIVLVVYEDYALTGDVDGYVPAIAHDHIKVVVDLLNGQHRRRRGLVGVGREDADEEHRASEETYFRASVHGGNVSQLDASLCAAVEQARV